mmetsp:Transcript_60366/g.130856  ORF Transcript_60366/g.130856 Transcript_60366/m.130856 type:complete len:185 (-) Transcript_60366:133-687(-)|eukprot:CAMPEP_0170608858 /NCGR_PEP_ID=MMETSP0224-20130122/21809_1 /TAXON_ID=285029 /ORGANISM="Togula jolla, Strain CCCM 725" /LENGTH=184 /DNA_ID=CAMNT_0010934113 /DNA_START=35 /DNA_END=589 /DNA_ORIENTATION=+
MGHALSVAWARLTGLKDARLIMVGLDAAGKTTILFKLKLNEVATTIPTIGFNVESVQHKNLSMTIWDMGGQDKIRRLWRFYYTGVNGVIFVIDSSDRDRIGLACEELQGMLSADELRDAALLVFANKQDLPNAMSASEVTEKLSLSSQRRRQWWVQAACATNGSGLAEGLDWMAKALRAASNGR